MNDFTSFILCDLTNRKWQSKEIIVCRYLPEISSLKKKKVLSSNENKYIVKYSVWKLEVANAH